MGREMRMRKFMRCFNEYNQKRFFFTFSKIKKTKMANVKDYCKSL